MSHLTPVYYHMSPEHCTIVLHLLAVVIRSPDDFISSYFIPIPIIIPSLMIITDPRVGPSCALFRRKPANLFTQSL